MKLKKGKLLQRIMNDLVFCKKKETIFDLLDYQDKNLQYSFYTRQNEILGD